MWFSSISDVENVHLQNPNMLDVDILQLIVIETQDVPWKHHSCTFICWGFFCCQQLLVCGFGETANVAIHNL
jgi:hypothetical protein